MRGLSSKVGRKMRKHSFVVAKREKCLKIAHSMVCTY